MRISVVIPTYNEEKNIENCLIAFTQQTIPRSGYEIIIVDGQSKDKTCEVAKKYADKVIQQVSQGVGGARNDGASIARGEIIATTDADCLPNEIWLAELLKGFNDGRTVAVTGYLDPIIPQEMSFIESRIYIFLFWIANGLRKTGSLFGYYHLCGANTAFHKDSYIKIGGYSNLAYSDDVEIAKRLIPIGRVKMNERASIGYSIRRIKKMGLIKYVLSIFKNDFEVMIMGKKPIKGNYAKQEYNIN